MTNSKIHYDLKESLVGKLLISTPNIGDMRFIRSVVLIVAQNINSTLGIVLNKTSAHKFYHIIKSIKQDVEESLINTGKSEISITLGGSINAHNLFVVHTNDYKSKDTVLISDFLSMTNQPSIILDTAKGDGPKKAVIAIGCVTWAERQLEQELMYKDAWLISDYSLPELLQIPQEKMYEHLCKILGIADINSSLCVPIEGLAGVV